MPVAFHTDFSGLDQGARPWPATCSSRYPMIDLKVLGVGLVVGALQLVTACADEAGKASTPQAVDTTRLALARRDVDLVLVEVDLRDGAYTAVTEPIAGWFNTVDGYSRVGASAQLWANREHTRAVMFGNPHSGGESQLLLLRGERWERGQTPNLQRVLVSPQLGWIVTSSAASSEPFSEEVLTLSDYEGQELLSVVGRQGLSTVAFGPNDAWVLLQDGQEAVVVEGNGQTHRFVPALGAAGQTDFGWTVSAAFDEQVVFDAFGDVDGEFVRAVHTLDGTVIDADPSDYERVEERYIVTSKGRVQVATDSGFEDVGKVPASFEPGFSRLVANSERRLLVDSQKGWFWFDASGAQVAKYVPTLVERAVDFSGADTLAQSASEGMFVVEHQFDDFDQETTTLDAFRFDGVEVQSERAATLPVPSHQLGFSRQPGSPWIAWAAVDIDLSDDYAGAYNTASGKQSDLSKLPRIESWATYGGL